MIFLYCFILVHIRIKLPVKLTEEQREVLEEYARLETDTPGAVYNCNQSIKKSKISQKH